MEGMIQDLTANKESLEFAAKSGFSTATDLADWLVRVLNLPFRDAHHVTGEIVSLAERTKCDLSELELKDMQKIHSDISEDVFTVLSIENSVNSRSSYGGTSPKEVQFQIDRWKKVLG
jgi:argininosuccinate lyase